MDLINSRAQLLGTAGKAHDGSPDNSLGKSPFVHPPLRHLQRLPRPRSTEVLVVPVGGLGRIGMNWTLYGHDGSWILVDAGIAFPDDDTTGVDAFIPDPETLRRVVGRIDALVVTHAHEDHIGAIQHVFPRQITCPIWATPFAAAAISRRLEEAGTIDEADIRTFPVGGALRIGPFAIRSIRLTHSVPESVALAIATTAGTVLHTGDFKLDPEPLISLPTDFEAIHAVGDAGLLALVCDSTNAERDLPVTSEAQVRASFRQLFASRPGIVVVCCFGTNVARAASACDAAARSGRQVALTGRSLRAHTETAERLGILRPLDMLAEPSHLRGLDRREMALVCTGTQGEENAVLARLATGKDWRLPELGLGDTVIMSASVIPGNEAAVERVLAPLRARGVEILTQADAPDGLLVHVSGHAGRAELATMHRHARPRFAIPVHGTEAHLQAHARLALDCGAEAAPVAADGAVMAVSASGIKFIGRVEIPVIGIRRDEGILLRRAVSGGVATPAKAPAMSTASRSTAAGAASRGRKGDRLPAHAGLHADKLVSAKPAGRSRKTATKCRLPLAASNLAASQA